MRKGFLFSPLVFWLTQSNAYGWLGGLPGALQGHDEMMKQGIRSTGDSRFKVEPLVMGVLGMDFPDGFALKWKERWQERILQGIGYYDIPAGTTFDHLRQTLEQTSDLTLSLAGVRWFATNFFGVPTGVDWHNSLSTQRFHFLRTATAPTLEGTASMGDSCEAAKDVIRKASFWGLLHWGHSKSEYHSEQLPVVLPCKNSWRLRNRGICLPIINI